jgi:prohibitin 1
LTFGKEFTQAVELKQVAQQDAERARFLVEKAEQQKKAAVISAEGDSQVSRVVSNPNPKTFFTGLHISPQMCENEN